MFKSFDESGALDRSRKIDKGLYDLKALGLVTYDNEKAQLTKKGIDLTRTPDQVARSRFAIYALELTKIRIAYEAHKRQSVHPYEQFESLLAPITASIESDAYKKVTISILKSWARFVLNQFEGPKMRRLL